MVDMEVIVRRQDRKHCASITCMIRHYVARRAQVTEGHPHNAESSASPASHKDAGERMSFQGCLDRPPIWNQDTSLRTSVGELSAQPDRLPSVKRLPF